MDLLDYLKRQIRWMIIFYPEYLIRNVFLEDEDEADTFTSIQTMLQEYVKSSMAQFIVGELDLEADWDSYVETLQGYGVDTYVQLYQKAVDALVVAE